MSAVETRSSTFRAKSYDLMSAGRNVLVVTDDEDTVFLLKTLLGSKGYQVRRAWDGRQAVEIAETEDLDLILLDLQLPAAERHWRQMSCRQRIASHHGKEIVQVSHRRRPAPGRSQSHKFRLS